MALRLRDKVALVTGGSRGLGPHIARALAERGVHVALAARSAPALEEVAARLRALGVRSAALVADVAVAAERERLLPRAEAALGPVDILVNNAGVEPHGDFAEMDPAEIAAAVELNVTAPMHLTRLALPALLARGAGHVVTMGSLGGKKGAPYDAVYCGTKAALVEWSDALRGELHGSGVGCSVICPGYVRDDGMFARAGLAAPGLLGSCSPEEVARAVVRAIERDRGQIIVNSRPVRPLLALYGAFPNLGAPLLRLLGIAAFQRRKARALSAPRSPG